MDHLFTKSKSDKRVKRHYVLEGFYSHLKELKNAKESYYDSTGIDLVEYSMDENGYESQIDIIKKLVSSISNKTSINAVIYDTINILMSNKYSDENFKEIKIYLNRNNGDNPFVSEFFKSVINRSDYLSWLLACYKDGFFLPKNYYPADRVKEGKIRSVGEWAVHTLNQCLQKNKHNVELIKLASDIVNPIIERSTDKNDLTDNFILTKNLLEIVLNLTDSHINNKIILFIENINFAIIHMDKFLINSNYLYWKKDALYKVLICFFGYKFINVGYDRIQENLHLYQLEYFSEKIDYSECQIEVIFDVILNLLLSLKGEYSLNKIKFIENIIESRNDSYYGFLLTMFNKFYDITTNKEEIIYQLLKSSNNTFLINVSFYTMRTYKLDKQLFFAIPFNPFDNTGVFTELYALIQHYKPYLTESEKKSILNWIRSCDMDIRDDWEFKDKFINTQKTTIYSLLFDVNEDFKKLYDEYRLKDIWEIKNPIDESKMYDIGSSSLTRKPMFTSEEIPDDVVAAIIFIQDNFGEKTHSPETVNEILKYIEKRFKHEKNILNHILLELPINIVIEILGLLYQAYKKDIDWKSSIYNLYEELIDRELSLQDTPNEYLVKIIVDESKFKINKQLDFSNYWNNIMSNIFDFYIDCLIKLSHEVADYSSRISEEEKNFFVAFLERDISKSFRYVIAERVDAIIHLNKDLITNNLDNIFKYENVIDLRSCLSVMNKCQYI